MSEMKRMNKNVMTNKLTTSAKNVNKTKPISYIGSVTDVLREGKEAINTSNSIHNRFMDQMDSRLRSFLEDHRSKAGDLKLILIKEHIDKGDVKFDELLEKLTTEQETHTTETVRLMSANTEYCKAQGSTFLKAGFGIFIGTAGISVLTLALNKAFGKKDS